MKFIFPQNYKFNTKILGLIDYQTAILNLIWDGFLFLMINLFFQTRNIKIFLFIIFAFPMLIFSVIGINGDNFIQVMIYMIKFLIKPKLLFYGK